MGDTSNWRMTCPHCGRTIRFGDKLFGKAASCPGCKSPIVVMPNVSPPAEKPRPNLTPVPPPPADPEDVFAAYVQAPPVAGSLKRIEPSPLPPPPQPKIEPAAFSDFVQTALDEETVPATPIPEMASSSPPPPPIPSAVHYPSGPQASVSPTKRTGRKTFLGGLGGLVGVVTLVAGGVWLVNSTVNRPLQRAIENDNRNRGIAARAHYGDLGMSVLVFDLTEISSGNSRLDVFRVFLQYAEAVKDKRFESVQLRWRGKTRFSMTGSYFQTLGREFGSQNPAYTIRTFPENLRTPTGDRAFPVWEGGMLGVLKAQMEDFNRFHDQWYLDDLKRVY